jgi:hypothetical protein
LLSRFVLATHVLKTGFLSNVSANSMFLDRLIVGVFAEFALTVLALADLDLAFTDFALEDALRVFAPPIIL